MRKTFYCVALFAFSCSLYAAETPLMECGPFTISSSKDGFAHINGQRPESQKFTFLGQNGDYSNVRYQWMLPDPSVGRWLGIEYLKRNKKAILNVEVVRTNMDQPREFWTYDCRRIK